MVSKFIFLVMRDFFLENNAFEKIIVNDEINHSFLAIKYVSQCIKRYKQQKQTFKNC